MFVAVQHYTRDQLLEQINFTRQHGYSISDERLSYGVRAVAVPIRASDGSVHSSLSMAAHANAVTVEQLKTEYLPRLVNAATAISQDWERFATLPNRDVASIASSIPPPYAPKLSL